ncbi:ATP-binding protein [Ferrimonas sp. SCSIO 43195]|uniref:ATP-binding protein n=1 Tax=Ferrimonas sp. SCSIO 43195 TaxID=2822844 RepID=UPI00207653BD|nr:ATP-binding protein [Ferrimonas sp. SCSIO 43195]USD36554.1 ATP-binding protein [Ferrimonas sp. SCSIO 43195]
MLKKRFFEVSLIHCFALLIFYILVCSIKFSAINSSLISMIKTNGYLLVFLVAFLIPIFLKFCCSYSSANNFGFVRKYFPFWLPTPITLYFAISFCLEMNFLWAFELSCNEFWFLYLAVLSFVMGWFFYEVCVYASLPLEQLPKHNENKDYKPLGSDYKKYMKWLENKDPIDNPVDDLFGFSARADILSEEIKSGMIKNVCLQGAYGSGKSSLVNLIEFRLKEKCNNEEYVVLRYDSWGRNQTSIAYSLLRFLILELSNYFDCASLNGMPSSYRDIYLSFSKVRTFQMMLNGFSDESEMYNKLGELLGRNDLKLLLVIEDLDRNYFNDEKRNELPALLDRLKSVKNLMTILSIGSDFEHGEVIRKISDRVEFI